MEQIPRSGVGKIMRRTAISIAIILAGLIAIANGGGTVITAPVVIPNNAVTDAKLRDSAGLSVIGRSANSSGDPADITASSDGDVLRRSGVALGFGAIPEASVTNLTTDLAGKTATSRAINTSAPLAGGGDLSSDRTLSLSLNGIDDTFLRDSAALSVIGRSVNSSGDPGDISTSADGDVLRRSGVALGFGQIATAGITDAAVTSAKLRDSAALSVIGRSANSSGVPADIAAATDGDILRRSGTSIGFGTVTTASISNYAGGFDYGDASDGNCAFDGATTPVCGATLSGSTYTLTKTVFAADESVTSGVIVLTQGWADYVDGTFSGSGTVHRPGGNGSGTSAGGGGTGNNFFGPGGNGGAGGGAGQGAAGGAPAQGLGARDCGSGTTALVTGGNNGNTGLRCGGGSGGGGGGAGSSSNASGSMSLQGTTTSIHTLTSAISGRAQPADSGANRMYCGGTGGSGGGLGGAPAGTPGAGGGGGGGGGYVVVVARHSTFTGTISAKGGNGANGANGSGGGHGGGGGAGGGGGVAVFLTGDNGYSLATVTAAGGTGGNGGTGAANGGRGGDGGAGVTISKSVGN